MSRKKRFRPNIARTPGADPSHGLPAASDYEVVLENTASAQGWVTPGSTVIDTFTLTNNSGIAGTFAVSNVSGSVPAENLSFTLTVPGGGPPQTFPQLDGPSGLNAALAALNELPIAVTTATIGVSYAVPANAANLASLVTELTATLVGLDSAADSTVEFAGDSTAELEAENTAVAVDTVFASPVFSIVGQPAPLGAQPGAPVSDSFTLTNLCGVPGNFGIPGNAQIIGPTGPPQLVGYTFPGQPVPQSLTSLNAWLQANPVNSGASVTVGVQYIAPDANAGLSVVTQFSAAFTAQLALGASAAPVAIPAAAQTATVVDPVSPQPKVTIGQSAPHTVTPAMQSSDTFTLTNISGQPATFTIDNIDITWTSGSGSGASGSGSGASGSLLATKDYGASLFRGFTVNGKDVAAGSAPLQALQDAVSALAPIAQGAAVTIAAIYVAPSGQPGDHVATTLAAHASAGGISQPPPALPPPGKVDNVLGAFTDILTTLAEQLYAQYRQPTPAETVSALLTQADADLKAFVNGPTGVIVTSSDLARTLAIHDLADDLYGRLINAHRQPAQLDTVPSIN